MSSNRMIMGQTNELTIQIQKAAITSHKWMTCINCINWNGDTNNANGVAGCGLFKAMPPPHIIVSGCKDHDFDIPF